MLRMSAKIRREDNAFLPAFLLCWGELSWVLLVIILWDSKQLKRKEDNNEN